MGFIPEGACWYLADIVLEHVVEDDPRNLVYVNTHLIKARSPDEVYEKAMALGLRSADEHENTEGRQVRTIFRGLRQLSVIHEPLEDGAELMYGAWDDVPEEKLQGWIVPKERLNVFAPIGEPRTGGPNTCPAFMRHLLDLVEDSESEAE